MCVTNIAKRRNAALSANQAAAPRTPSLISQRLMSNFLPMMMNNPFGAKPLSSTVSTLNAVEMPCAAQRGSLNSFLYEEQNAFINTPEEKKRPKRRRKPQKPGKTAKQNDRHFVVHNYHDHAWDPDESDSIEEEPRRRGGVAVSFPARLHAVLDRVERDGWGHVISWQPHGRCFLIHKPNDFQEHVMPAYFGQNKLTSWQRQLNLYGFCRLTRGPDAGAYYHELFLRGRFFLTKKMLRTKIKGTKFKASSNPEQEPDFYSMPPVMPSGHQQVSDDSSFEGSMGPQSPLLLVSNAALSNLPPSSLVSPSVASRVAPLSWQGHPLPLAPTMESYPVLMPDGMSHNMLSKHSLPVTHAFKSSTDDVLDKVVDELFHEAKNSTLAEVNHGDEVSPLWDSTEFGQEAREDDLQLGFMLDLFLQE